MRIIRSIPSFDWWLVGAKPGDRVRYHRGLLILDRLPPAPRARRSRWDQRRIGRALALDALADRVAVAAEAGMVRLVQRPAGIARDYLAERVPRPTRSIKSR